MSYATWNPADKGAGITLSGGDLTAVTDASSDDGVRSTVSKSAGKWYWEITCSAGGNGVAGVANASASNTAYFGGTDDSLALIGNTGNILKNGSIVGTSAAFGPGDIVSIAYDADAGTVEFRVNNASSATISGGNVPTGALFAAAGGSGGVVSTTLDANFGATSFTYSPPSGHTGLTDLTDFSVTGSGGALVGGEATTIGNSIVMSGGVSVGGAATLEFKSAFLVTGSGGAAVSGAATVEFVQPVTYEIDTSGGVELGGAATVAEVIPHVPTGGAVLGGAAVVLEAIPFIPSGGVVAGGTAPQVVVSMPTVSGGAVLAGSAPVAYVSTPVASGGLVLAGAATIADRSAWHMPSGGMVLGGTALAYMLTADYPATTANPYARPYPGWALNLENSAPSRYARLPANSICHFNGVDYCANAGGIYSIDADADDGQEIRAGVQMAKSDYGLENNKRVDTAYLAARASGNLRLSVSTNNGAVGYYLLTPDAEEMSAVRVPLGRGLEGRYWTWRVDNVDGCDLELESLVFTPTILKRKGR